MLYGVSVCFVLISMRTYNYKVNLGLADTLTSELALYDIKPHIFFPPTMYTPGYEEENMTKPAITLKIEETDDGLTPEAAAKALLRGMSCV